jgi:hypothetical protein
VRPNAPWSVKTVGGARALGALRAVALAASSASRASRTLRRSSRGHSSQTRGSSSLAATAS